MSTTAPNPPSSTLAAPLVNLAVGSALVVGFTTAFSADNPNGWAQGVALLFAGLAVGRPAFNKAAALCGVDQQGWDALMHTRVGGALGQINSRSLGLVGSTALGVGAAAAGLAVNILTPTAGEIVANLTGMGVGALSLATAEGMDELKLAFRRAQSNTLPKTADDGAGPTGLNV